MNDTAVRILLGGLAAVLFLVHAGWGGDQWRRSSLPVTVGRIGIGGVVVYVLAGQVKGVRLVIPVDWTTWLGVGACTVSVIGFTWELARRFLRRGE